ncbi:MAG: ABC transporter ATP-binding protein [Nitrospiria bacterium]
MAEIILDQVGKRFPDGVEAIKKVSFTIRDGEFLILLGPSGCGKSTLLNMIVGLEAVTEGEIRMDGKVINDIDPKDRNMAMVFQNYALYPHMTVRENMSFPLKMAKAPRKEIYERVVQTAEILGLGEMLDRKPSHLSGGQRQRVAMGRAIVRRPSVFLLDEPLSNLDAQLREQMRAEIARIQRRLGVTTVYVTHDQTEAMTLGDRVVVLYRGEAQQIGTPRALYEQPRNLFVAAFIGAPAMNFLPAKLDGHRLKLPIGEIAWPLEQAEQLAEGTKLLTAGIRPEDFKEVAIAPAYLQVLHFQVMIDIVEWLGAERYVHFEVKGETSSPRPGGFEHFRFKTGIRGNIRMVARLGTNSPAAEGEKLRLCLDISKVLFFDSETGERLSMPRR